MPAAASDTERHRLQQWLDSPEPRLDALRAELCRRIGDASIALGAPGLLTHLQRTALDRLAIEQPGYAWAPEVTA